MVAVRRQYLLDILVRYYLRQVCVELLSFCVFSFIRSPTPTLQPDWCQCDNWEEWSARERCCWPNARHTKNNNNNSVKPHSHANSARKWITYYTLWAAGLGPADGEWVCAVCYHINHHWHVPQFIILACMRRASGPAHAHSTRNKRTHIQYNDTTDE